MREFQSREFTIFLKPQAGGANREQAEENTVSWQPTKSLTLVCSKIFMQLILGLLLGANSTLNVASRAPTRLSGTCQLDPIIELESSESFSFEGSKMSHAFGDHFDTMNEHTHGVS